VSDEAAVQAFIDGTIERFGRVDYAANVAGVTRLGPGTAELSNAVWDEDYAINLKGLFLCERAELQAMLRQEPLLSE
jgi:NAD(P)-dependent dehydrogenase (short-subunit alcohol dehydrogenase family)